MIDENKNYEIGFLIKSESDREEIIKALKDSQFSIIGEGQTQRIKLAYPIKKETFAYFSYLHFSGQPADIQNLNNKLKTGAKILRFSIVPQPIAKESRFSESAAPAQQRGFSERPKIQETPFQASVHQPPRETSAPEALSNEALEKKLEEILK